MPDLWTTTVDPDQSYTFRIGSLCLWIRYIDGDWFLAQQQENDEDHSPSWSKTTKGPEPEHWKRFASGSEGMVRAAPAMPDRPLLVRPEKPVVILPEKEALFFVSIPINVEIFVGGYLLDQIPTEILSNSWFGDTISGELCYATRTRALRNIDDEPPSPASAVCPVLIRNQTAESLPFQRFCLRTEFLGIYQGSRRMWTNQVEVVFMGAAQLSQLNISVEPPNQEILAKLSEPRKIPERNLLKTSFKVLKQLTEL